MIYNRIETNPIAFERPGTVKEKFSFLNVGEPDVVLIRIPGERTVSIREIRLLPVLRLFSKTDL